MYRRTLKHSRKLTKAHNDISRWRSISAKLDNENERKARETKGKKGKE